MRPAHYSLDLRSGGGYRLGCSSGVSEYSFSSSFWMNKMFNNHIERASVVSLLHLIGP